MHPKDRIIVALDVPNVQTAQKAVETLSGSVGGFKVGYELFYGMAVDAIQSVKDGMLDKQRVRQIAAFQNLLSGQSFIDLKFLDIPETVRKAVRQIMRLKPKFINLHAPGGKPMMQAARQARDAYLGEHPWPDGHKPKLLAVTVLTSLTYDDLAEAGLAEEVEEFFILSPEQGLLDGKTFRMQKIVVQLALNAQECGLDGVVASAQEARAIREACGKDFLIVTPGIRPAYAAVGDQKRVTTPAEALQMGADYLVIGRPILDPPVEIGTPVQAAQCIVAEILQSQPV